MDTSRPDAPWPTAEQEVYALDGEITWSVDFDAAAEAAGKTDCSYTRRYTGVEDRSRPWTCRSCNVQLRAEVEVIDGREDCYAQVTESDPAEIEWVGYSYGNWWRSTRINRALGAAASARVENGTVRVDNVVESQSFDEHALTFTITGELVGGTTIADPLDGLAPPEVSSCGWDRTDVEVYDGSTRLRVDWTFPDAYLLDACGEGVRLHQFSGQYLVVAWVAEGEASSVEWLAQAADQAASMPEPTRPIAIASLGEDRRFDPVTADDLARIGEGLSFPVLGHRGYGDAVMADGDDFTWPVVAVVAPDRRVVMVDRAGFSGWSAVQAAIEAHAAPPL